MEEPRKKHPYYFGALLEERLSRRDFFASTVGAVAVIGSLPTIGAVTTNTRKSFAREFKAIQPSLIL